MYSQRKAIAKKVFQETSAEPYVIRIATVLASFLHEKEIIIFPEDLFAGYAQFYDFSVPIEEDRISLSSEERSLMDEVQNLFQMGMFGSSLGGHVVAGYRLVLEKGFGGLIETARKRLAESEGSESDFVRASLIVCQSASEYVLRYATKAYELAREVDDENYRQQLTRIAEACQWVAFNPPRTFFEAIQVLWFTHEIITCEQYSGSISLGRIDQYLYQFYANDILNGVLTREEASELIEALWIKLSGLKGGFQNVILGGSDIDGRYMVNDLSYICLQATKRLRNDQPLLSVRWHPNMPEDFWNEIVDLIKLGLGFPALFNDEIIILSKCRMGIPKGEVQNYAIIGCVEPTIPAKEFAHTEGLRFNWAKVIELILNDGKCTTTGRTVKLKNKRSLSKVATFEEFYEWFNDEMSYFLDLGIRWLNISDRYYSKISPYPFLSAVTDGCLEKGLDVTEGGTDYNFSTVNGCGMANTVDSLIAIKKFVFEEKKVSLSEFAEILRSNFRGAEIFRQTILVKCPKFGNDDDEPDTIMKDLVERFCHQVESYTNPRGGKFQAGLYTVNWHALAGISTGALPDGRLSGTALANGLSPSQGADKLGPTAVIRSLTKMNHRLFCNGMVLDLKFHPSFFSDEKRKNIFKSLVETYFRLGGMEVQFNVVDRKILLKAQQSPEEYQDLIVRVSGYSAYFIDLNKVCQDEIIARTEYFAPEYSEQGA